MNSEFIRQERDVLVATLSYEEGVVLGCAYRSLINKARDSGEEHGLIFGELSGMHRQSDVRIHDSAASDWLEEAATVLSDYQDGLYDFQEALAESGSEAGEPVDLPIDLEQQIRVAGFLSSKIMVERDVLELKHEDLQPEHFR